MTRPVIGSWGSVGSRKAASISAGSSVPSGRSSSDADAGADDDGVAGRLVEDDVVLATGDRLLAAREVGQLGDEVAHRPGGDEQAGLLAEQLGGALLEGDDGRVVAEDVVADLGLGHRAAHRRAWAG